MAAQKVANLVAHKYSILNALAPDKRLNLAELSQETGQDKSNLSKYTRELRDAGLLHIESVPAGRGRPQVVSSLTPMARRIMRDYSERPLEPTTLKAAYLDTLIEMISSDNPESAQLAAEELEIQTAKHQPEDPDRLVGQLLDAITKPQSREALFSLSSALRNTADPDRLRRETKQMIAEKLKIESSDPRTTRNIIETINANHPDPASYLTEQYIQAVLDGSPLITAYRQGALEHASTQGLRLRLLQKIKGATEAERQNIKHELGETR